MPKIAYIEKRFTRASLALIDAANDIIAEYMADGIDLTLRQLYYQFVARGLIENTQRSYKRLGSVVNDGRLAGHIDWRAIQDRGRNLRGVQTWADPAERVRYIAPSFCIDKWEGQPHRVEVWVEKQALEAIIARGAAKYDADFIACKGYMSQSEMWAAAQRFRRYERAGQKPVIIHLGDHDPSGIDMTRDMQERAEMFWSEVEVDRIALNMSQVEEFGPPPNPAKFTDSRFESYVVRYGDESWELDALEPRTLIDLIAGRIEDYLDRELWEEAVAREERHRDLLRSCSDHWEEVVEFMVEEGFAEEPE
ncbi:MAG: hypothetical protein R3253_02685 [Longimicrobiales bacterium]|nr:hypothetical protein [Longimicrobiales bacterium]